VCQHLMLDCFESSRYVDCLALLLLLYFCVDCVMCCDLLLLLSLCFDLPCACCLAWLVVQVFSAVL
jgi:hypothetical protein